MIYFFNANMELKKVVNSENVVSAVHEHELNGVILSAIELDLSYARAFKDDVEYFGYYYENNFYIHKIRRVEEEHENELLVFVGRHIFFDELMTGELVQDVRPVERDAVYTANATIGNTTRWKPFGNNTTKHLSSSFYWELPIEVLNTIVEQFQVEYLPIIEFDGKKITDTKLRIDERIGKDSGIRIPYGSRVLNLKYDIDYEQIITKLFVQGRGEEVGDGYGRRINIKDVNFSKDGVISPAGVFYLYDQSLIDEYGVRHGKEIFEDIEDVNELAQAGYDYYIENSRPKMLFTAEVAQIGNVSIGDTVNIIRREYDLYFKARIHKITVNLLNKSDASVELGDYEHFKESKVDRIERKNNEIKEKQTNNRIESLKRQFDTEFDSQVEEFRKEFEQKLIDVSAEIQADKEAFELQYKADKEALSGEIQSSYTNAVTEANRIVEAKETDFKNYADGIGSAANGRIDDLYRDVGNINQTVSDVGNKADYLDGVYTDLSTQTGQVSSTVANIIDGKAPVGSVLKQTIDGVVGRVWQTDIDNLNFENRNLIRNSGVGVSMLANNATLHPIRVVTGTEFNTVYSVSPATALSTYTTYRFDDLPAGTYVDSVDVKTTKDLMMRMFISGDFTLVKANVWTRIFTVRTHNGGPYRPSGLYTGIPVPEGVQYRNYKTEHGNKATPYSVAPEELMKYGDIVLKSDGFLLGNFEMGGDKIAQAILGKAGAIDLIADNVNFTGNVNVANQIKAYSLEAVYADIDKLRTNILTANSVTSNTLKVDTALINKLNTNSILTNYLIANTAMINNIKSKSLEAVYADISELRTRMLVADVITADMVKFDTALIEKFTSSTAFINSLTAKSAFISNIKAIDIDFNRATAVGSNGSSTLLITAETIEQRGRFNRTYFGRRLDYDVTTTIRGGYLRFGDNDRGRAINMSAFGFSTYLDGDGGGEGSSGAIQWWDDTYSPSGANGLTISSYGGVVALRSESNRVVLEANNTVMLESKIAPIDFHTHTSGPYNTLFRMTKTSDNKDGYLVYGAGSGLVGLRFIGTSQGKIEIVDSDFKTGGTTSLEAGKVLVNTVENRATGRLAYWNGSSTGTIDDVSTSSSGQLIATSMITARGDLNMYLGTRAGGALRVTNEKGYNSGNGITYRDIEFQNWKANSHEDSKYEIQNWSDNILDVYRNELRLKKFKLNSEKDLENQFVHRGIVIRNNSSEDEFPAEWRSGDGFNGNEVMWWNTKAIQELALENDSLKSEIAELKSQINKIMEMIK